MMMVVMGVLAAVAVPVPHEGAKCKGKFTVHHARTWGA
jgi:hypothetical protein